MGRVDECQVAATARRRSLEINAEMHATLVKEAQSPFAMKKKGSVEQLRRQTRPVRQMDPVGELSHQHSIAAAEREEDEENEEFDRNMPSIARKPRRASLPSLDEPGRPSMPKILPPTLVESDVPPPPPPAAQSPPPPPPSQDLDVDELQCFSLRSESSSASLSIPCEDSAMDEDGLRLLNQVRRESTNSIDGKTLAKRSERRASMPASTKTLYLSDDVPASPRPTRQTIQPPSMFAHPAPRRISVDLGNLRTENEECLCASQGKCFACVGARRGSGKRSPRGCTCGHSGWCIFCVAARRNSMPASWSKLNITGMSDKKEVEVLNTARRASVQLAQSMQPELEKRVNSPFVLKRLGSVESVKRHRVSVSSSASGLSRTNSEEEDLMRVLPSPRHRKPRRASMHSLTEVPVGACSPVCANAILA